MIQSLLRLITAYVDLAISMLEKWTAEIDEYTKKMPERAYWRGYEDAYKDLAHLEGK